jgi:hypothetical protein
MVNIMSKFQCPVAKCEERVYPQNYYAHVKRYEKEHEDNPLLAKSHDRFANYFFKEIWESDLPPEVKWRKIAIAYKEQQKKLKVQAQKKKGNEPADDNITMKDGKVIYNGEEYTPEQFSQMQKGVKYLPLEHR